MKAIALATVAATAVINRGTNESDCDNNSNVAEDTIDRGNHRNNGGANESDCSNNNGGIFEAANCPVMPCLKTKICLRSYYSTQHYQLLRNNEIKQFLYLNSENLLK